MEISKADFGVFRDYLERVCGILLGDNKEYLVASRLRTIVKDKELNSLAELVKLMESDSRLRETVVDAMTTNETLWFRDAHPFQILQNRLLPEFCQKQKSIDIWCAASSTGQEPYSISMVIDEFKRANPGKLTSEKIMATDISPSALNIARSGVYDQLALGRGMPKEYLDRYFKQSEKGWQVDPKIQARVQYRMLNLLNNYSLLGRYDIVFCRNVLIYFSSDLKQDILRRIHSVIKPGGYLFLGASEALSGLPDLYEMVQCSPGIIYRKK
ncbi:protein-glutamate O-methyltransferase CheR [Bermanella marisrubri]|uniref:protein-glutamate O-methyltransferase n=1 Tax=Bermanella marisrubri TaxID=207949 RepID=Q1N306_9GAMM|nr:protein-glutamate O-methyltransferase CheR [Bermanella marisrubri]EAT12513.1 chemotaxis protein methyltransferase CheR [Oceanobacter sp. RED65] [Bermanella marisrubri]QIZ84927.1 protein-glutamate O-methyltransferase CheR [Bermanella marisrubri]